MNGGQHRWELSPDQVRRFTNPVGLGFDTTEQLPSPDRMVGQSRAGEAIDFALEIEDKRYNLYVAGEPGSGRLSAVLAAVQRASQHHAPGHDWCYVHNFEQPTEPHVLSLPAGTARTFARDVDGFVLACRRELRRAFTHSAYERQREEVLHRDEVRHTQLLDQLQQTALALGFMLRGTPSGLEVLPVRTVALAHPAQTTTLDHGESTPTGEDAAAQAVESSEPEPLTRDEFEALSSAEQDRLRENRPLVDEAIERILPEVRAIEEVARNRIRRLDRDVATRAVKHLADGLSATYAQVPQVTDFLHHLRHDIIINADVLTGTQDTDARSEHGGTSLDELPEEVSADPEPDDDALGVPSDEGGTVSADGDDTSPRAGGVPLDHDLRRRPTLSTLLRRYRLNVLVARKATNPAPFVHELNPTYTNLVGSVGLGLRDDLPFSDHLMIRPGSLHRANDGFLVLQVRELMRHERAWEAIKRMLRFGTIATDAVGEGRGLPASAALQPEPIPAQIKVVLVGDEETYGELFEKDPDFHHLFKVRAEFDTDMARTPETESYYARFTGQVARSVQAPALTSGAVALLIEESSRWANDQGYLSTQMSDVSDLTREACFWAARDGAATTTRLHVGRAIAARERRLGLVVDKHDQQIRQGVYTIETSGEVVGQINGLTVLQRGEYVFGVVKRITARTSPGWGGIINIERETDMSGPLHAKGVLILTGFLAGRFAQEIPLSLSASICFEQTHGPVDGDSASSTELYALLSCLSGLPIKQTFAVTGAVDQRGNVQAVGGVTYKVESFYRLCRDRGLTGEHGVVIPRSTVRTLMLREEIVEAVRAGKFHIYAIDTIDEGIEILTGIPAGRPTADGRYLEGTVNARIQETLRRYSERVRTYGNRPGHP